MHQTPLRRAAILVHSLPPEAAAKLLANMETDQRRRVREEIRRMGSIDDAEKKRAIASFLQRTQLSEQHNRNAAASVPAPSRADRGDRTTNLSAVSDNAPPTDPHPSFEFLEHVDEQSLELALRDLPVSTVAVVLAQLPPHQAARLLKSLPTQQKDQVIQRLSRMDEVDPAALAEISDHLRSQLSARKVDSTGSRALRAIVAHLDEVSLNQIKGTTPGLAQFLPTEPPPPVMDVKEFLSPTLDEDGLENIALSIVRDSQTTSPKRSLTQSSPSGPRLSWTFDELQELDPHLIRRFLAELTPESAVLALLAMRAEVAESVLDTLPRRQAKLVRREIGALSPIMISEVDAAREKLLATANQLRAQGMLAPQLALRTAA
jgi:flagellar motor switch protein FliG